MRAQFTLTNAHISTWMADKFLSMDAIGANYFGGISICLGDAMHKQFLRIDDLTSALGLSKSTIYALISAGEFPRQIRLAQRAVGWSAQEIEEWAETRKDHYRVDQETF